MLKLGMVATAATAKTTDSILNQQFSLIRPGISYNQAVKANVVCHLINSGTGSPEGTDMSKYIDDTLKNLVSLKPEATKAMH